MEKDAHGHNLGSHAAHGPEGTFNSPQSSDVKVKTSSDIETVSVHDHGFEDTVSTQVIGVGILEFGVVLHRSAIVLRVCVEQCLFI